MVTDTFPALALALELGDPDIMRRPPRDPGRPHMPSSEGILQDLTVIANEWRLLALGWHLLLAAFVPFVLSGSRLPKRLVALLLASPMISVSAIAWGARNPFNGTMFALVAAGMVRLALVLPQGSLMFGSRPLVVLGTVLVGFGWTYPHFLESSSWTSYLYEAPLGLVPCPTLSVVVGFSLILGSFQSRAWAITVASAAMVYGVIGVFALGVAIDLALLAGAVVLGGSAVRITPTRRTSDTSLPDRS